MHLHLMHTSESSFWQLQISIAFYIHTYIALFVNFFSMVYD